MIDLYAEFVGGRSEYCVESFSELKREVAIQLNRNDINWNIYNIYVNDEPIRDDYEFVDGDVVKVMSSSSGMWSDAPTQRIQEQQTTQMDEMVGLLTQLVQNQQPMVTQTSTTPTLVVKRPFIEPELERPDFAVFSKSERYVGGYACGRCGGNIATRGKKITDTKTCVYCGLTLNWASIS